MNPISLNPTRFTPLPMAGNKPQSLAPPAKNLLAGDDGRGDASAGPSDAKLRKTFDAFVGQTLFGQMLGSMRSTLGKSAYFHGGRAEEVFQSQLDQVLAEKMAESASDRFTGPMFDQFLRGLHGESGSEVGNQGGNPLSQTGGLETLQRGASMNNTQSGVQHLYTLRRM